MSRTKAVRELCDKIRAMVAAGEPLPSQLVRIARSQTSLEGVTPQFMLMDRCEFHALPAGVLELDSFIGTHVTLHDMWRPVQKLESTLRYPTAGVEAFAAKNGEIAGGDWRIEWQLYEDQGSLSAAQKIIHDHQEAQQTRWLAEYEATHGPFKRPTKDQQCD